MEINNNTFNNLKLRWFIIPVILTIIYPVLLDKFVSGSAEEILSSYIFYLIIFLWVFYEFKKTKINYRKLIGNKPKKQELREILTVTIFIILMGIGFSELIFYIATYLQLSFIIDFFNEPIYGLNSVYYNVLLFPLVVIFGPIVEELLFRGVILNRLAVKWGLIASIILSSLLFGSLHADLIGTFIFGLMMAVIYVKTQTLWAPIICHILNNFTASLFEFTTGNIEYIVSPSADIWIGILCLTISTPYVAYYLYKNWPKKITDLPYFST